MGFSTSGLAVAETGGGEAVDAHVDEPLDARVLEDVLLTGLGLKDDVESEGFELVIAFVFINLIIKFIII